MGQLKRIVISDDLCSGGEMAVQAAQVLADRDGALKLVHVVEPHLFSRRATLSFADLPTFEDIVRTAKGELEKRAARSTHPRVESEVRTGKPFVELIATCRAWQGDLLVVGISVKEEEHTLGSTSERVVRKAPVPVLVIKKPLSVGPKTVLVPTDFSACAAKAAEEALTLVRSFGGRVIFLHALDIHSAYPAAYGVNTLRLPPLQDSPSEAEWQAFLAGLSSLENLSWEKRTEEGQAAATIVRLAEESKADLIVMGTHGRSGLKHMLLGSVAEQVVRTAACSTLSIRPDNFAFELP